MIECDDDHGYRAGAWEDAHLTSKPMLTHWHPETYAELEGWLLPDSDRVRDREFDIVEKIEPHSTDPDMRVVTWAAAIDWFEEVRDDNDPNDMHYEIGPANVKRFLLLPHQPVTDDEVNEATASILSTYQEDA